MHTNNYVSISKLGRDLGVSGQLGPGTDMVKIQQIDELTRMIKVLYDIFLYFRSLGMSLASEEYKGHP